MKGLEPEIQRLIAQHKTELKKIKSMHEEELLESDERASQRYVRQIEELRDQLASEKETACARERQLAKESYVLQPVNQSTISRSIYSFIIHSLQCFDAVGWATGRDVLPCKKNSVLVCWW